MLWVFAFSVAAVIIILILVVRSSGKAMDKKAHDSGAEAVFSALHVEGISVAKKTNCDLYLFSDKLLIDAEGKKFEIPISRLVAAQYKSEQELIEKNKSVLGRALIGTLLVPGLGTIVGGMTGIGNKQKKGPTNFYLIINYTDSNGELSGVTFLNNLNISRLSLFSNKINQYLLVTHKDVVTTL